MSRAFYIAMGFAFGMLAATALFILGRERPTTAPLSVAPDSMAMDSTDYFGLSDSVEVVRVPR